MSQSSFVKRFLERLLVATAFFLAPLLFAGSEPCDISKETPPPPPQPWCETPQTLEIRIGVPGWMAGVSGNSGVKGVVTSPDVNFDQILTHLTHVPLVLSVDVRNRIEWPPGSGRDKFLSNRRPELL
jgi:hypothetical protein